MMDLSRVGHWLRRWAPVLIAGTTGLLLGAFIRGLRPPFVIDDPLVREFITSPAMAGLFALLGAIVAFAAAMLSSRASRRAAQRQEWWDRAQWALQLATSTDSRDRDLGLRALEVISLDATPNEVAMIDAVTDSLLPAPPPGVDGNQQTGDNGTSRRWYQWQKR